MALPDDELLAALKEAGHEEAATALEQKLNAAAAAGHADAGGGEGNDQAGGPELFGRTRLAAVRRKEGYPDVS